MHFSTSIYFWLLSRRSEKHRWNNFKLILTDFASWAQTCHEYPLVVQEPGTVLVVIPCKPMCPDGNMSLSICFQLWRITQPLRIRKLARVGLFNPGWKQILRTSATNYLTNFKRDLATSFQMTLLFEIVGPSKNSDFIVIHWYELRFVVYVELRFYRLRYIISYECKVKLKFTYYFRI